MRRSVSRRGAITLSMDRQRPLSIGPLRAFAAVARHLNFNAAAAELHLTQSAVSRKIQALESDVGATLLARSTRSVELSAEGRVLVKALFPMLDRLDEAVRQIRSPSAKARVTVSTFASFTSLWLLPRLEQFQREHTEIDIRVSSSDAMAPIESPDTDVFLRYCAPKLAPAGATRLFNEALTPVMSAAFARQIELGDAPPLKSVGDLARHTLVEEDDAYASAGLASWRHWLRIHNHAELEPRNWMHLNFTYQQVQAAVAGHALALARLPLVADLLGRNELREVFGEAYRTAGPGAYWMIVNPNAAGRPEVSSFCNWILQQAAGTRAFLA
jgi:LysR family glycine cleavage system transcriptional activator